jgi:thiazole synthase ThiGH ThiG subunit
MSEWTAADTATIKRFAKKVMELALMSSQGDEALRECQFVVVLRGHEWETVCRMLAEVCGEQVLPRRAGNGSGRGVSDE